ncbi:zinc finger protein, partial [Culex quinquefasciatus]|uniref:zinc finger protein n=1 Tax=Culex quinquefasciatus TaxID=7176 RepID=UPI0018E314FF
SCTCEVTPTSARSLRRLSRQVQVGKTLQEHKLIHTKEKPFQCDICEKWFRTKTLLRNHKFLHTGLRPHVRYLQQGLPVALQS